MKRLHFYFFSIFTVSILLLFSSFTTGNNVPVTDLSKTDLMKDKTKSLSRDINFGDIPLYFIQNQGQVDKTARFYAKTPDYTLWVTNGGLVFDQMRRDKSGVEGMEKKSGKEKIFRDVSRLLFVGANKNVKISSLDPQKLKVNYFKGNDRSKWVGGIPTTGSVLYKNIYKNIDLKVYGIGKQIEYDWIIHPGGNPSDIKFEYKNVKGIGVNKKGDLDITTQFGTLTHKKPYAYQKSVGADPCVCPAKKINISGKGEHKGSPLQEISSSFKKISNSTFGFITGKYDNTKPLIIDPVILAYSTFLGGTSSDRSRGITVDNNGIAYIAGETGSTDFPTLNQYQIYQAIQDSFLTKIDTKTSGASCLLYSSYIGGAGIEYTRGIAVDSNGYVYIAGFTNSTDYPTRNPYQGHQGSFDGFISKFDTSQSGASSLLYSTYLGGNFDDYCHAIAVDNSGYAYITGSTSSTNFPTLNQYQGDQGGEDGFVSKIDTNSSGASCLLYSSYIGGASGDNPNGIAVDSSGYVYIAGSTNSTDYPTRNQYQATLNGGDGIISKFDTTQSGVSSLLYSTYLGGSASDTCNSIAVNSNENAFVTGDADSNDFPLVNPCQGYQGVTDAFAAQIDTRLSGASSLIFSTYLGGSVHDFGYGIEVDTNGYIYVAGRTDSTNFPILHQYQSDSPSGDGFVLKLDPSQNGASCLLWSTYLGGNDSDTIYGLAIDTNGFVYVTGYNESSDFPIVNQYQAYQGSDDAFISKLSMEYSVNAAVSGGNGSVSPASQDVRESTTASINISPAAGYTIASIIDNGTNIAIRNPYRILNIGEDHNVVVSFERMTYQVTVSAPGGNGMVSPVSQNIEIGENATIHISPSAGYRIGSILDNGSNVPVSNPYIIYNVRDNHSIVVEFIPDSYPPELNLTGVRKTERAWILTKEYTELNISIMEHPVNPAGFARCVLLKSNNGLWQEIESYITSGIHTYTDRACEKGKQAIYKLVAYLPDGRVAAESDILTL